MDRWKRVVAIVMLALWVPGTSHSLLESAGWIHEDDAADSDFGHDAADGNCHAPISDTSLRSVCLSHCSPLSHTVYLGGPERSFEFPPHASKPDIPGTAPPAELAHRW